MLSIWCNADLSPDALAELRDGTAKHRLFVSDKRTGNLGTTGASEELAEADVAFGQPDPAQLISLPNLRWAHLTSAGYTRYDNDEVRSALRARGAALTNSSSVYDEPCAQHVLSMMLSHVRQLPASFEDQMTARSWAYDRIRAKTGILEDETVLILGFGAIGRRLAELVSPFRVRVVAVRRRVTGSESVETHPIERLHELLAEADYVANVLPLNPSTDSLMDEKAFGAMKNGASFYNVGRGSTVDQAALIAALESGRLGGAYLDVTDPEPLPSDHPLWTTKNCHITPHIGGGRNRESSVLVQHFLSNLERFVGGSELGDRLF